MEILTIRRVRLDSLRPDPTNVRVHDERNLDAIAASLTRFGQQKPIVVGKDGVVVAGNGTLEAAKRLGWTEIDVVETELTPAEARAFAVADNRSAELASWNEPDLAQLLVQLQQDDLLTGTGFSADDIQSLLDANTAAVTVDQDEVPEPPAKATTRRADLWVLGRHRLLCGDSAEWSDVERLLGGAEMHLLNTDPPYGVKVEPRSNNAIAAGLSSFGTSHHQKLDLARHPEKAKPTSQMRPKDRPLTNDYLSDEEFARLLRAWFGNASRALLPGRAFYVWGGYANLANYPAALAESGLYFSQAIVWDKQHPVLTRKDFMGAFEIAFYGWKIGAAHEFLGPPNATDLWHVKKVNPVAMSHLTEKPVELASRAIQYSSRPRENVLDLFGGSGSTMAACEQLDRTAYLMEIDELYADVIVERWQRLTGEDAVLDGDGRTFAEVAKERGVDAESEPNVEAEASA